MANVFAESQPERSPFFDLYLYLANVKTHLANHKPMDDGDEGAWELADFLQEQEMGRG